MHEHRGLEAQLRSLFERHGPGSVAVTTLAAVFEQRYATNVIGMACASLAHQGLLVREKTRVGSYYSLAPAGQVQTPTRQEVRALHCRPLKVAKPTIIPVRGGGRVAPVVSDGPYVGLSSKAQYYERIDQ